MTSKTLAPRRMRTIGKVVQNDDNYIGIATYCRYSHYLPVPMYSLFL